MIISMGHDISLDLRARGRGESGNRWMIVPSVNPRARGRYTFFTNVRRKSDGKPPRTGGDSSIASLLAFMSGKTPRTGERRGIHGGLADDTR